MLSGSGQQTPGTWLTPAGHPPDPHTDPPLQTPAGEEVRGGHQGQTQEHSGSLSMFCLPQRFFNCQ